MTDIRSEALNLLHQYVANSRMIAHSLASEAVMRKVAEYFEEDPDLWGLCGLLHDIDVEITSADPLIHGTKSRDILEKIKLPYNIIEAIELHNEMSSAKPRNTRLHHALAASETITGLIFATAMVYPDKKISSVKVSSVIKRMKEKHFAASVKRENILECERIGLTLEEFTTLSLQALSEIQDNILS